MSLDANLGTLRWMPLAYQVGNQSVTVKLVDSQGASVSQSWTIAVHGADLPPDITSSPVVTANQNKLYTYAVQVSDPTGTPLTYSLTQFPTGMSINATTGL